MSEWGRLPPVGRNLVNQRGASRKANIEGALPAKIQCYVCKKHKSPDQYANVQLRRFQDTIHNPYAPAGRCTRKSKTTCRMCTPGQTQEITCSICNETMGLDKFAKNQRDKPERARCIRCVELHKDTEPDITPPSSNYESDSDSDFEGGRRKVTVKIQRVIHGNRQYDDEQKAINHTADSEDDSEDDGWNEVECAGPINKADKNVFSFKKMEEEARHDVENIKVADAAQMQKNDKIIHNTTKLTSQRSTEQSGRFTTSKAKSKWGAPVVDPLGDNQWDHYARGMDHSRQVNIKKTKQKEHDSSEGEEW